MRLNGQRSPGRKASFLGSWKYPILALAAAASLQVAKPWEWLPHSVNPWWKVEEWRTKKCDKPEIIGTYDKSLPPNQVIFLKTPDGCKQVCFTLDPNRDRDLPQVEVQNLNPDWKNESFGRVTLSYERGMANLGMILRAVDREELYAFVPEDAAGRKADNWFVFGVGDDTHRHFHRLEDVPSTHEARWGDRQRDSDELIGCGGGTNINYLILASLIVQAPKLSIIHYHPSDRSMDAYFEARQEVGKPVSDLERESLCRNALVRDAFFSSADLARGMVGAAWLHHHYWGDRSEFKFEVRSELGIATAELTSLGIERYVTSKRDKPFDVDHDPTETRSLTELLYDENGRLLEEKDILNLGDRPVYDANGKELSPIDRAYNLADMMSTELWTITFRPFSQTLGDIVYDKKTPK